MTAQPRLSSATTGSPFAETHLGHGTDFTTIAGVLGFLMTTIGFPTRWISPATGHEGAIIEWRASPYNHPSTADITNQRPQDCPLVGFRWVAVGRLRLIELGASEPTGYCQPCSISDRPGRRLASWRFAARRRVVTQTLSQAVQGRYLSYFEDQHHFPQSLYYAMEKWIMWSL